jgi:hypothetical protein
MIKLDRCQLRDKHGKLVCDASLKAHKFILLGQAGTYLVECSEGHSVHVTVKKTGGDLEIIGSKEVS